VKNKPGSGTKQAARIARNLLDNALEIKVTGRRFRGVGVPCCGGYVRIDSVSASRNATASRYGY
jgi:hypothetical protein